MALAVACRGGGRPADGTETLRAAVAVAVPAWSAELGEPNEPAAAHRQRAHDAYHEGRAWERAYDEYRLSLLAQHKAGEAPSPEAVAGVAEALAWGADSLAQAELFRDALRLVESGLRDAGATQPGAWHLLRGRALLLDRLGSHDEARTVAESAWRAAGDHPMNAYALGLTRLADDAAKAAELLAAAAARAPASAPIGAALARAYLKADRHTEAEGVLRRLIDGGVRTAEHRGLLAEALLAVGRDDDAAALLGNQAAQGGALEWPGAELALANLLRRQGRPAEAAARLKAAAARAKDKEVGEATRRDVAATLALALYESGALEEAEEAAAAVVAQNHAHALANVAVALATLARGGPAEAEAALQRARNNVPPQAEPALTALEAVTLSRQGRYPMALELLQQATQHPRAVSPVAVRLAAASVSAYLGKFEQVDAAVEEALGYAPDTDARRRWTHVYRVERALYQDVVRTFTREVKTRPWLLSGRIAMGIAYAQLGQWTEALAQFTEVARRRRDDVGAQLYMGFRALTRGQHAVAQQWVQGVLRAEGRKNPASLAVLAAVQRARGDTARAREAADAALALDKAFVPALVERAALAADGAEARALLDRAVASDPDDLPAQRARGALARAEAGGADVPRPK